jgi:hypothetical protein
MRLSSPDAQDVESDQISPAVAVPIMATSPTRRTSTSFPSVHRALYEVQGLRLGQSADVDISNLLQLPQYYWNNWDQWTNSGILANEGQGANDLFQLNDPLEPIWDMPIVSSGGNGAVGLTSQYHGTPNTIEAQSQEAVTTALLRYMLDGAQGGS